MEWQHNSKAAPGKPAVASAPDWFYPVALALLPPESAPARLHAARAAPTRRGESVTSHRHFATSSGSDPLPCTARAFAALVGRALRVQRARPDSGPGDDQIVRRPRRLCYLTPFGNSVAERFPATGFLLLGHHRCSEWPLMALFPGFSSSSAFSHGCATSCNSQA